MSKCEADCLTCRRSTCIETRPIPGEPREEEPKPTTSRVAQLEAALRECITVICGNAKDVIWAGPAQTLVEYIDEVLANDDQGELFEKD
jgi:hypothetical protein